MFHHQMSASQRLAQIAALVLVVVKGTAVPKVVGTEVQAMMSVMKLEGLTVVVAGLVEQLTGSTLR
jgi:hypothetical protein